MTDLFGTDTPDEAPAIVAPRVIAPRVEGPKAQPLALDLFPTVGLFEAGDEDQADEVPAADTVEDTDDELVTVQAAERSAGYLIPAPVDPAERAAFEQGVAAREAAGLSPFVGEDYLDEDREWTLAADRNLVAALAADLADEAPGVTAAFRLLAEAAEALDARNPNTLDDVTIDLTWREHQNHPTRDVDWLLLGLVEGRPAVCA